MPQETSDLTAAATVQQELVRMACSEDDVQVTVYVTRRDLCCISCLFAWADPSCFYRDMPMGFQRPPPGKRKTVLAGIAASLRVKNSEAEGLAIMLLEHNKAESSAVQVKAMEECERSKSVWLCKVLEYFAQHDLPDKYRLQFNELFGDYLVTARKGGAGECTVDDVRKSFHQAYLDKINCSKVALLDSAEGYGSMLYCFISVAVAVCWRVCFAFPHIVLR